MSGQWGTSLCACTSDVPQSVDNCLCFPCQNSRQLRALEGSTDNMSVKYCVISCFCATCASARVRMLSTEKYGIDESKPLTALLGCCLAPCSSCQVHRELTLRNAWPGGTFLHKQPGDYTQMK